MVPAWTVLLALMFGVYTGALMHEKDILYQVSKGYIDPWSTNKMFVTVTGIEETIVKTIIITPEEIK